MPDDNISIVIIQNNIFNPPRKRELISFFLFYSVRFLLLQDIKYLWNLTFMFKQLEAMLILEDIVVIEGEK